MSNPRFRMLAVVLLLPGAAAPGSRIIFGTEAPAVTQVRVADTASGGSPFLFFPYGPAASGGVRVALGDLTGDGQVDLLTASRPESNGLIKIFDGQSGQEIRAFLPFPSFGGEIWASLGDLTGDGFADILVGAGAGIAGGQVKVFDGRTLAEVQSIIPFSGFPGVRVAAGDINGDGRDDLIVGTGPGPVSEVRVISGRTGLTLRILTPFADFQGGVYVAAGDLDGDGRAEVLVGSDSGSSGQVKAFGASDTVPVREFLPFGTAFTGGVRVAFGDVTGDGMPDLAMAPGPGAALGVVVRPGPSLNSSFSLMPFAPDYSHGTYVGSPPSSAVVFANAFE